MSGDDTSKPEDAKTEKRLFETTDFSASLNSAKPDPNDITIKAGGTLVGGWQETPGRTADATLRVSAGEFPTDIPGFSIVREIGRGAFGVVYAANDEMLERKVAIKRPLISDPKHRQQYIDEARKAVKLEHPGIVPIYHVGTTSEGEPFVVQKLIEGSSLRGLLKNNDARLPILQVVSIMRQVCLAVEAAHAAGMVHRDLKPENLLVEPEGRAYVADFGLAILEDEEQSKKGREIAGTPFYMSPEQFSGRNEWLDGRSDIWALGVIFYELLSGKTPFSGNSISELKDEIKNKDPRPIHQRDPNIPPAFDTFFRKCCAKQVSDRFASVHELIDELDSICKTLMLDPVEWETRSKNGLGSAQLTREGPFFDTRRDTLTGRGLSTHRNVASTVRRSLRESVLTNPSMLGSIFGAVLTSVLTLALVVSGAWYLKLGPFAIVPSPIIPEPVTDTSSSTEHSQVTEIEPTDRQPTDRQPTEPSMVAPTVPVKPFVVSIKSDGTHTSIAKAIQDSAAGDTITVLDGTYRESLIIDRAITLIGKGEVRCIAVEKACLNIRADSEVVIENIDLECQADEKNTIELFSGRLQLKDCDVFAGTRHSHDCVRARSNSTFSAERCQFQSMEEPAIYADPDSTITVQSSTFTFPSNTDFGKRRSGIQATGAAGLIRDCDFKGPCVAGIDWMDCPDQKLILESCRFENCELGIQTSNCNDVTIRGTAEQPCEIRDAHRAGIHFEHSEGLIDNAQVLCTGQKDKVGLQITKDSRVRCSNGTFQGMQCGVIVNQSKLIIDSLIVRDAGFAGMLVDEAGIEAKEIKLLGGKQFGFVMLSSIEELTIGAIEIEAAQSSGGQLITPAIYAASGEIKFTQGAFRNCLHAFLVDPERIAIKDTLKTTSSIWADLINASKRADQPLPRLTGDRLSLIDCQRIWMFLGTGTSKIRKIEGNTPLEGKTPELLYPEKLALSGNDFTDFTVLAKNASKN